MSTADDAERDGVLTNGTREPYERGYADGRRAGYRRALEDAAEVVKSRFEHGRLTTDECELVETWLRGRAAGVGIDKQDACLSDGELASNSPTKDGDDDE